MLAVLCLPAIEEAHEEQIIDLGTTLEVTPPTNLSVFQPNSTEHPYLWDYNYTDTSYYRDYQLKCGSVAEPRRPPVVEQTGERQELYDSAAARLQTAHTYEFSADSYQEALAQVQSQLPGQAADDPLDGANPATQCAALLGDKKWVVFAASPIGWVVIGAGLVVSVFIGLALFGGGFGGGGISGSLTPNITGGFTLRLWR